MRWRYNKCVPRWPHWFWDPFILVTIRYDDKDCQDWDCFPAPSYLWLCSVCLLGVTLFHIGYENYEHFANLNITILNFTFYFDTI